MIKIGIFGIELDSVNYGVTALAISQLRILQMIAEVNDLDVEYYIFSNDNDTIMNELNEYISTSNIKTMYLVRLKTGVRGIARLIKDINEMSFIIDLTYGDSFSDIYGKKNFYVYTIPKLVTILKKKRLIIAPQTIGPFYDKVVKSVAKYVIKNSDYIFARDDASKEASNSLYNREDIIVTSDLAMELPYKKGIFEIKRDKNTFVVGLNVSLLLWNNNSDNSNISMKLSYKEFICSLISELHAKKYEIHLITHVYNKTGFTEYALAKELNSKYPFTVLAPQFRNPMEAKSYISELDFFIGSRMHATIGAFSAGVPVIPVAYSRKFEGLYNTLGYPHCIDCSRESLHGAIEKIMYEIDNMDRLRMDLDNGLKTAFRRNNKYKCALKEIMVHLR